MNGCIWTYGISLDNLIPLDSLRDLIYLVRYIFRCGSAVRNVVFYSEVVIGASRIVARSEQDTTIRLVFADYIRCSRCRKNRIFPDNQLLHPVCRSDPQDSLNGLGGEVTTITSNDERGTIRLDGIEYSLDKVLCVMLITREKNPSSCRIIAPDYRVPPAGTPSPFGMQISMAYHRDRPSRYLFLSPDVPGFCPSNGLVEISLI
jgi:hypothetical protein